MRRLAALMAVGLCMALLLSGCDRFAFGNARELLRAPELGQAEGQAQRALAESLTATPTYKYPLEGDIRSPLLFVDLDGDGIEECVIFYTVADYAVDDNEGDVVWIAVLEQKGEAWEVRFAMQGRNTQVASVAVADMRGDGSHQLVVGYSTKALSAKSLTIYDYTDKQLNPTNLSGLYNTYLLGDFAGKGREELAIVREVDTGLDLFFLAGGEAGYEYGEPLSIYEDMASCIDVNASVSRDGERFLILDGKLASTGQVASQIFSYSEANERFFAEADAAAITRAVTATVRSSTLLTSRDIDGDGVVEIPVPASAQALGENAVDASLAGITIIEWMDFTTGEEAEGHSFGVFDQYHTLYIQLPEGWKGDVQLVPGTTESGWQVVRSASGRLLMEFLNMADGGEVPEGAVRVEGTTEYYVVFSNTLSNADRQAVLVAQLA